MHAISINATKVWNNFQRWKLERLIKAIKIIDTYRDFVLYNDKLEVLNSCLNGIGNWQRKAKALLCLAVLCILHFNLIDMNVVLL